MTAAVTVCGDPRCRTLFACHDTGMATARSPRSPRSGPLVRSGRVAACRRVPRSSAPPTVAVASRASAFAAALFPRRASREESLIRQGCADSRTRDVGAVVSTLSDAHGEFALDDVPADSAVTIAIEIGGFRRVVKTDIAPCTQTRLPDDAVRLPRNAAEGELPMSRPRRAPPTLSNVSCATSASTTLSSRAATTSEVTCISSEARAAAACALPAAARAGVLALRFIRVRRRRSRATDPSAVSCPATRARRDGAQSSATPRTPRE